MSDPVFLPAGARVPHGTLGKCPACGQLVHLQLDDSGQPRGLLHETPACETFDAMDAEPFVAYMHASRFGHEA